VETRVLAGVAVFLLITIGLPKGLSAESASVEKAKEEGKLVAYLAMNAADAVKVQTSFSNKFPQIQVDLVRAGAPAILQRILTEYVAERCSRMSSWASAMSITS
jgi:hypothetical protein